MQMPMLRFDSIRPLPPLLPHEIRYLRKTLRWNQEKLGQFIGRDTATISRWEAGSFCPDAAANGALYSLWVKIFGVYEGPYRETEIADNASPAKSSDAIAGLAKVLLAAGVGFFIAKGIDELYLEDNTDE